jgi:hypothetical protein
VAVVRSCKEIWELDVHWDGKSLVRTGQERTFRVNTIASYSGFCRRTSRMAWPRAPAPARAIVVGILRLFKLFVRFEEILIETQHSHGSFGPRLYIATPLHLVPVYSFRLLDPTVPKPR